MLSVSNLHTMRLTELWGYAWSWKSFRTLCIVRLDARHLDLAKNEGTRTMEQGRGDEDA
jgi:hypothetical protein